MQLEKPVAWNKPYTDELATHLADISFLTKMENENYGKIAKNVEISCNPNARLVVESGARPSGETVMSIEYQRGNSGPISSMVLPSKYMTLFFNGMGLGCGLVIGSGQTVPVLRRNPTPVIDAIVDEATKSCGPDIYTEIDETRPKNSIKMRGYKGNLHDAVVFIEGVRMGCEVMKSVTEPYCDDRIDEACGIKRAEMNIKESWQKMEADFPGEGKPMVDPVASGWAVPVGNWLEKPAQVASVRRGKNRS